MRSLTFTWLPILTLLSFSVSSAGPAETLTLLYNDIGVKLSGTEANCFSAMIFRDDAYGSKCLEVDFDTSFVKNRLNNYLSDVLQTPWRHSDYKDTYSNTFTLVDDQYLVEVVRKDEYKSYINLTNVVLTAQINQFRAAEVASRNRAAGQAGATPNTGYVPLGDLRDAVNIQNGGVKFTLSVGGQTLQATRGKRDALLDGRPARLNAVPVLINGVTYFPLAALKLLKCTYRTLGSGYVAVECPKDGYALADLTQFSNSNPGPTALVIPSVPTNPSAPGTSAGKTPASAKLPVAKMAVPQPRPAGAQPGVTKTAVPQPRPAGAQPGVTKTAVPQPRPAGAQPGVAYVSAQSLNFFGSLDVLTNNSFRFSSGEPEMVLTFAAGQKTTAEGQTLEAAPYLDEGLLWVPISALKLVGCTVVSRSTGADVACAGQGGDNLTTVVW